MMPRQELTGTTPTTSEHPTLRNDSYPRYRIFRDTDIFLDWANTTRFKENLSENWIAMDIGWTNYGYHQVFTTSEWLARQKPPHIVNGTIIALDTHSSEEYLNPEENPNTGNPKWAEKATHITPLMIFSSSSNLFIQQFFSQKVDHALVVSPHIYESSQNPYQMVTDAFNFIKEETGKLTLIFSPPYLKADYENEDTIAKLITHVSDACLLSDTYSDNLFLMANGTQIQKKEDLRQIPPLTIENYASQGYPLTPYINPQKTKPGAELLIIEASKSRD